MNRIIIGTLIFTCFIVFIGFLAINEKLQFIQNSMQYENRDESVAGYKISVNEYTSGLFRTKKEALKKSAELQKGINPYPENLKYLEFITVMYETQGIE